MSTRDGHNREVRKRLKALSAKFNELYEVKVKEFDNSYSGAISWVQGVAKTVEANIDGFDIGLPAQKKFKVSSSVESKINHSTLRLPKNFELFHSFNLDRDGANKRIQNGSVLFRSLHNDVNWVAAASNTPRAAPKTPGRRNRIASNLFNKPTLRGQTPLKIQEALQNQTPGPQSMLVVPQSAQSSAMAAGTPSKALFDSFTPIRETTKQARPALVRRPLGSPYQEPSTTSRRVAASETRPGPQSRLGKEHDTNEDGKRKTVKRKGESTVPKKMRNSVRIQNKEKLREALESDKENEADGEEEDVKPKPRRIAKRKSSTKTAKRPARPAKRSRSSVAEEEEEKEKLKENSDVEHEEEETPKKEAEWKEIYKNPTLIKKARRTVQERTISLSSRRKGMMPELEKQEDTTPKTYVIDMPTSDELAPAPHKPKRTVKRKFSKKPSLARTSEAAKLKEAEETAAAQQEERRVKEQQEQEEKEREEREQRERKEREAAAEREKAESERVERERQEKEQVEREKAQREEEERQKEKERVEQQERERQQKIKEEWEQKKREKAEAQAALEAEREKVKISNPLPELRFSIAEDVSLSPSTTAETHSEHSVNQKSVEATATSQVEKPQPNKAKYQLYKDGLKEKLERRKQESLASQRDSTLYSQIDEKPRSSIQPVPNLKTASPLPIQTVQFIADESLQGSGPVSVREPEEKNEKERKVEEDALVDEMKRLHRIRQEEQKVVDKSRAPTGEREKLTNSGGKSTTNADPKKIERSTKSRNLKVKKEAPTAVGAVDARLEKAKLRREQQLKAKEEQNRAREEKEEVQRKQVEELKKKREELLLAKRIKEEDLARKREENQKKMMVTLEADKQKRMQERVERENQRKEQEEREKKRAEDARKEKEKLDNERVAKEKEEVAEKRKIIETELEERKRKKKEEEEREKEKKLKEDMENMRRIQKQVEEEERQRETQEKQKARPKEKGGR